MKSKNPIDELFAQKLSNAEQQPSNLLWERIAAQTQQKKQKKRLAMWQWTAIAASLLLAGFWIGVAVTQQKNTALVAQHSLPIAPTSTSVVKVQTDWNKIPITSQTSIASALPTKRQVQVVAATKKQKNISTQQEVKQDFSNELQQPLLAASDTAPSEEKMIAKIEFLPNKTRQNTTEEQLGIAQVQVTFSNKSIAYHQTKNRSFKEKVNNAITALNEEQEDQITLIGKEIKSIWTNNAHKIRQTNLNH